MPQDNIKRAIARATGADGAKEIEEMRYEGYGPAGAAVILEAATDNRNRTAGELRFLFSRYGGSLGESNSVAWMFEQRGFIEVDNGALDEDALTEAALVDGVVDVRYAVSDGRSEVVTEPAALAAVREELSKAGLRVRSMLLGFDPKQSLRPADDQVREVVEFLEALEEHEDVQHVFSNAELDAAQLAALA
jgi:YebC/PmpR family DNA-binding regulatory protein